MKIYPFNQRKNEMKVKELDKEITEILMCMYNSGDTTNCLADIKKLILEAEIKKGLQDFQICREELTQQRTELFKDLIKIADSGEFEDMRRELNIYFKGKDED
jgi:hypothetical protein